MEKRSWTDSQETAMNERDKLLLVSAAAGSGKTSVLTERIIRRLLDRDDPVSLSELLIVTFTRSAAAELKSRIAKALGEALAADPSNARLSKQLLLLGSAQISTIDAYFQQVVRSNFEHLGLPSSFRIASEKELYALSQEIMEELIAEFYRTYEQPIEQTETDGLFRRVRNNRFADCMDHISSGTSSTDLTEILLTFYGKFASYPQGISLLRDSAEQLRREAENDFSLSRAGKAVRKHLIGAASDFLQVLEETKAYHDSVDPDLVKSQAGVLASDIDQCRALLCALNGNEWDSVRAAGVNFAFANFQGPKSKPEWSTHYQNARNAFKAILKKYQENFLADSPVEIKAQMLATADLSEILWRFYSAFEKRCLAEKIDRGMLDFNDVRNATYKLLTDPENQSIVNDFLEKYREIYIDEYQDVDEIQDEIFRLIGGDHRFMVGDIKQSIYGFRGSDPSIFADYRRSMPLSTDPAAKDSPSVCVFMSENFRCDQTVIDFANAVCSFLFSACKESVGYLPEDDLQHAKKDSETEGWKPIPAQVVIFEKESPKNPKDAEKSEITTDDSDERDSISREARWVAAEVERLLREGRLNDGSSILPEHIAILSRNGGYHIKPYLDALEARGIPVSAESAGKISRSPLLIDLLNLLRAIDNPHRDIPLSEYLTTGFGGFTLEELSAIRLASPTRKSLYDAICAAAENADFPCSEKAHDFVEWLEGYRRLSSVQPADRFLRALYLDERFAALSSTPEFLALYEQARTYQRSSWCGLYGFLEYVTRLCEGDQLSANGFRGAESAVNVMTMHASKGLEFPVVFVVGCGKAFSDSERNTAMLYQKEVGFASNLYREDLGGTFVTMLKKTAKLAIKSEEIEGEIRLLYVALTRARERLYVTAIPSRLTPSLLNDVSRIKRDSRSAILGGKSFLDWILAALYEKEKISGSYPADIRWVSPAEEVETAEPISAPIVASVEPNTPSDPLSEHYKQVLERSQAFVYPLEALRGIPTKAAASKLRPDLLDILKQDDATAIEEQIRLMKDEKPSFDALLSESRKPTAAEIGTATHAFLEFCDLPNLSPEGIDAEVERLVKKQFLTPEEADILNRRQLKAFASAPLMEEIRSATRVLREQKFGLFLPLSELTTDAALSEQLKGQELFVQGSIDLVLVDASGHISLYDYKTDHITEEERADRALLRSRLTERHGNQLNCYAMAVENLFGKRPDKTYLFLLALGEAVEI